MLLIGCDVFSDEWVVYDYELSGQAYSLVIENIDSKEVERETEYALKGNGRFFKDFKINVQSTDSTHLKIYIDGNLRYNEKAINHLYEQSR